MSLLDKYEVVISPNIGPVMNSNCKDMNYYFENLIKNNNRVFLSEFISRQINDDNVTDVEKIIHDFLNDYIKTIRKNLRMSIKRRNSVSIVESFISLINNFSNKIYELEYFTKDINFKNVCFKNLFNSVLCDPITTIIFSRDIMDLSQKGKIKYLFLKINKIDSSFYNDWCISFVKNSVHDVCKSMITTDFPVSKKIEPLYVFSKLSNFLNKHTTHFNFLSDSSVFDSCCNYLIQAIENFSNRNDQGTLNQFLKEKFNKDVIYKIFGICDSKIKDDLQMKLIVNIIDNYKKDLSLPLLCEIYVNLCKNYTNVMSSMNHILTKEISKIIGQENLYDVLNNILINMVKKGESDNLPHIFYIISNLDDKNVCFKRYHNELMLRVLSIINENHNVDDDKKLKKLDYEVSLIESLKRCFTTSHRYKLNTTLKDMKDSINFNKHIKEIIAKRDDLSKEYSLEFNIVNTSYNIWDTVVLDVATVLDEIASDFPLAKFFKIYSNVYKKTHDDTRYLNWYLHTGSVNLNYETNNGTIFLKLLPIQALVLENFEDTFIMVEDFISLKVLSSYDRKEKEKILDVFVELSILHIEYDKILLNMDIPSCESEIDLIEPYFEVSEMTQNWDEEVKQEIANNEIDVVKCKINHHLKSKNHTYDELFDSCKTINVFSLNKDMFDQSLDYMVKNDFVEFKDNIYSKLLY